MVEYRDIQIITSFPIDWGKFRNQSVLITGSTGRLGLYIVEGLSEANIKWNLNIKIIAVARNEKKAKMLFKTTLELPFVNLLIQDITSPFDLDVPVDYIFHTAGLASPTDFTHTPVDTLWGHVKGTRNVLELARQKKSKKVLYVSTVEIYGNWDSEIAIKENDMGPLNCDIARSSYPEAKRLCETMLASYKAQFGVDFVSIRMSHTIGPNISLTDGRAFAEFIRNVVEGKDIVLHSDGSAVRTYTYIADAIGAMFLALTNGDEEFYNLANTNNQISIRDLANLIASFSANRKTEVKYSVKDKNKLVYLPFKLGLMDVSKISKLGWNPKVGIKEAFQWTTDFFIK
jgi:nucleoside-diphosphate-sugar epimerase